MAASQGRADQGPHSSYQAGEISRPLSQRALICPPENSSMGSVSGITEDSLTEITTLDVSICSLDSSNHQRRRGGEIAGGFCLTAHCFRFPFLHKISKEKGKERDENTKTEKREDKRLQNYKNKSSRLQHPVRPGGLSSQR